MRDVLHLLGSELRDRWLLLFGGLAALLVPAAAYLATQPDAATLVKEDLARNADGTRWLLGGRQANGLHSLFLLDLETGRTTFLTSRERTGFELIAGRVVLVRIGERELERQNSQMLYLEDGHEPCLLPGDWFGNGDGDFCPARQFAVDAEGHPLVLADAQKGQLTVRRLPSGETLAQAAMPGPPGGELLLYLRGGQVFEVISGHRQGEKGPWEIGHHHFDARTLELAPARPSTFLLPPSDYFPWHDNWIRALALAELGLPVKSLDDPPPLPILLVFGNEVFYLEYDRAFTGCPLKDRWIVMRPEGTCTGFLDLDGCYDRVAGLLRPGLLLVGRRQPGTSDRDDLPWTEPGIDAYANWTSEVVELPTGKSLVRLPGFKPTVFGSRTYLKGPYGELYDFESAGAEPRRVLPWRPLRANRFLALQEQDDRQERRRP